jgi:hypothetical protein
VPQRERSGFVASYAKDFASAAGAQDVSSQSGGQTKCRFQFHILGNLLSVVSGAL